MGKNYPPFWVVILPEEGPSQLSFISHLGQPSRFHCGKIDFQSLFTDAALLPPTPIIGFLLLAINSHLFCVAFFRSS